MKMARKGFDPAEWIKENLFGAQGHGVARLPKAEEEMVCSVSAEASCRYAVEVLKERLPEKYEEKLFKDPLWSLTYAIYVLKGNVPKRYESFFAISTKSAMMYSKYVIHGRLPENMHQFMVMKSFESPGDKFIKSYFEFVGEKNKAAPSTQGHGLICHGLT
jgi:hypothetical protein